MANKKRKQVDPWSDSDHTEYYICNTSNVELNNLVNKCRAEYVQKQMEAFGKLNQIRNNLWTDIIKGISPHLLRKYNMMNQHTVFSDIAYYDNEISPYPDNTSPELNDKVDNKENNSIIDNLHQEPDEGEEEEEEEENRNENKDQMDKDEEEEIEITLYNEISNKLDKQQPFAENPKPNDMKSMEIFNRVKYILIPGTQFSRKYNQGALNTRRACTCISFCASYEMSTCSSLKRLKILDWDQIIRDGAAIWRHCGKNDSSVSFTTVEDIKNVPIVYSTFQIVWENIVEFGGSIHDSVNSQMENTSGKNLVDSLKYMKEESISSSTTAVLTVGTFNGCNISISIWCNTRGFFAVYDSHGFPLNPRYSVLYSARNYEDISDFLIRYFNLIQVPSQIATQFDGTQIQTSYYSIYIFKFTLLLQSLNSPTFIKK